MWVLCVWGVPKVIGNRGHTLVKTKLCVRERLCLHSGAPAWLQRVWLWHYRTHLIGPIEMIWQPVLGEKREKRNGNSIYISISRREGETELEVVFHFFLRFGTFPSHISVYILNGFPFKTVQFCKMRCSVCYIKLKTKTLTSLDFNE